ncbi:hypothetical protein EJ03DRAFT_359133 [Teratosphaeria nubilosa]|uniref:Uncharacterized protein n=1 Tax=Teratosphaeria nubilosa TaxID=161662 RepID=A0A6G1KU12_9PEZI|nr:hypothetical protein EJ03DRAFT_359133 [Teratosphaeria nubilosa]
MQTQKVKIMHAGIWSIDFGQFSTIASISLDNFELFSSSAQADTQNAEDEVLKGSIDFKDIPRPEQNSQIVAAQGLLHILALGIENILTVQQIAAFNPSSSSSPTDDVFRPFCSAARPGGTPARPMDQDAARDLEAQQSRLGPGRVPTAWPIQSDAGEYVSFVAYRSCQTSQSQIIFIESTLERRCRQDIDETCQHDAVGVRVVYAAALHILYCDSLLARLLEYVLAQQVTDVR